MERSYPNSGDIQPRYAAWLGSLGLPISIEGAREARRRFGKSIMANIEFSEWIRKAKETAPAGVLDRFQDRIVDHEAFTEHCWKVAFGDVLEMAA